MDNSIFGLPEGSAFVTKGENTYQSLPAILDQKEATQAPSCMVTTSRSGTVTRFTNISDMTNSSTQARMICQMRTLLIWDSRISRSLQSRFQNLNLLNSRFTRI